LATVTPSPGEIDRLLGLATTLAGSWGARARATTSAGQERAILRSFGVSGLDRAGRPLAGATVDRWLAAIPGGLGGGIALPFAMALLEYDLDPAQLAHDVASGAVDLALEAELLRRSDRRAMAEEEAARLAGAAVERIDAQRTVRRDTIDVLGDAARPWVGTTLLESDVTDALEAAPALIAAGMDLLRVEIPIGRELADRLTNAGVEVPAWRPSQRPGGSSAVVHSETIEAAPTGSQRALTELRRILDRAAAERRAYVRLATGAPALWAPESAVVAAFERIDLVESDPMSEIVVDGVDPDRALADHAFADRLHGRAGTVVSIGAGPLVVGPDLRAGVPSDPATRSGRALALQLMSVALARAAGVPSAQIVAGALPAWVTGEASPAARSIAEVVVRRALLPDLALGITEPSGPDADDPASARWLHIVSAVLAHTGATAVVLRRASREPRRVAIGSRAAISVAAEVAAATLPTELDGIALRHARGMLAAAESTLEALSDRGWSALSGDPSGVARRSPMGGDAIAERTEAFDPFAASLGRRA
jgi:D-Lysine 5,6-aminomutase TIM-barrel domain of alpha subunit